MRDPHPLHIMETSFMESDTRLGDMTCQFYAAIIPMVKMRSPHACLAWDFCFRPGAQQSPVVSLPTFKEVIFYDKSSKIHSTLSPSLF